MQNSRSTRLKAVYAADTDQPVETDAWDAGLAVHDAFGRQ